LVFLANGGFQLFQLVQKLGFIPSIDIIPHRFFNMSASKLETMGRLLGESEIDVLLGSFERYLKDQFFLDCILIGKDENIPLQIKPLKTSRELNMEASKILLLSDHLKTLPLTMLNNRNLLKLKPKDRSKKTSPKIQYVLFDKTEIQNRLKDYLNTAKTELINKQLLPTKRKTAPENTKRKKKRKK